VTAADREERAVLDGAVNAVFQTTRPGADIEVAHLVALICSAAATHFRGLISVREFTQGYQAACWRDERVGFPRASPAVHDDENGFVCRSLSFRRLQSARFSRALACRIAQRLAELRLGSVIAPGHREWFRRLRPFTYAGSVRTARSA
jgi:hypothetical protein